jgi:hypothetical protein
MFKLTFARHDVCNLLGINQHHVFPIDANKDIVNMYLACKDVVDRTAKMCIGPLLDLALERSITNFHGGAMSVKSCLGRAPVQYPNILK